MDWFRDIVDMFEAFDAYIGSKPEVPPEKVLELRKTLIKEEVKELLEALDIGDLVKIAVEITDAIVVILGTAISYGIDIRPVWDEIHKSNLAKVGGGKRQNGKVLKPANWKPPRVEEVLQNQQGGIQ